MLTKQLLYQLSYTGELNAQDTRPPFSVGFPQWSYHHDYHNLLGAAFHLRIPLGATQSSNLADMTGLEPVTNGLTVRYSTN